MPSKSMMGQVKLTPPYLAQHPIPDGLEGTMKFSFIPIRSEATGPGCPYEIPLITCEKKAKKEQPATDVAKYLYCCAIVYGPLEPIEMYREPGDIWVNTGPNKSVWVVNGDGNCVQWPASISGTAENTCGTGGTTIRTSGAVILASTLQTMHLDIG
ncbi:hypothetical protein EWM64_g9836 [Hericium alpestre]|uniref:Uncharacterized protein n=1 Tax=Hericium alpestre TaxID=135208 RepID=A0A4Y9ZHF8_9AGAM|nr:hypothetical protein EWM64_g9836 [Hericium alpestre]